MVKYKIQKHARDDVCNYTYTNVCIYIYSNKRERRKKIGQVVRLYHLRNKFYLLVSTGDGLQRSNTDSETRKQLSSARSAPTYRCYCRCRRLRATPLSTRIVRPAGWLASPRLRRVVVDRSRSCLVRLVLRFSQLQPERGGNDFLISACVRRSSWLSVCTRHTYTYIEIHTYVTD